MDDEVFCQDEAEHTEIQSDGELVGLTGSESDGGAETAVGDEGSAADVVPVTDASQIVGEEDPEIVIDDGSTGEDTSGGSDDSVQTREEEWMEDDWSEEDWLEEDYYQEEWPEDDGSGAHDGEWTEEDHYEEDPSSQEPYDDGSTGEELSDDGERVEDDTGADGDGYSIGEGDIVALPIEYLESEKRGAESGEDPLPDYATAGDPLVAMTTAAPAPSGLTDAVPETAFADAAPSQRIGNLASLIEQALGLPNGIMPTGSDLP